MNASSQSALDRFLDRLLVALVALLVLVGVAVVVAFYWVWWSFIVSKPPHVARIWAIVVTTLVPFVAVASLWLGIRLGTHKSRWVLDGIREVSAGLAPLFARFGTEAADVRMYAGRGLSRIWRESKNSQELFLPPPSEVIQYDAPGNGKGVVEA